MIAERVGFPLILLLACVLRFHRLDFDLPDVSYVDGFKFVGQAADMVATGSLRPTNVQYPSLYVYILVALSRALGMSASYGQQLAAAAVSALAGLAMVGATICAAALSLGRSARRSQPPSWPPRQWPSPNPAHPHPIPSASSSSP